MERLRANTPGGLAAPREWIALTAAGRTAHLAALTPRGVRMQAEILATATHQPAALVLRSWVYFGHIDAAVSLAAAAIELDHATRAELAADAAPEVER